MKNLPAIWDTQEAWVRSLGWEDPLEEGMATPSNNLAWEIPWTEEPGRLQSIGSQRVGHTGGLSSCSSWALEHRFQQLWGTGLVALRHVESSRARERTRVPCIAICIARWIVNH